MADLKTRRAVKGTVKTIDRAAVAAELLVDYLVADINAVVADKQSVGEGIMKLT